MRYRIYDIDGFVGSFEDRHAFYESFLGKDPNNPISGVIQVQEHLYQVLDYRESSSSGYSENEFGEIDNDWYMHILVKPIKSIYSENNPLRERIKPVLRQSA